MPELHTYLRPEDIAFAIRTVLEQPRRLRTQFWTIWSMAQGELSTDCGTGGGSPMTFGPWSVPVENGKDYVA